MQRTTALITGASSGIGRDLARLLAQHGHDVVLVARREAVLRELAAEMERAHGMRATVLPADLSDPGAPEALAARLRERGLQVDILVNNAGFGTYGPFATTDLATQMRLLRVNITALTHLTGLFLPGMLARRAGRILNVASTAAFQPGPFMAVYYASKAFVLSFSEALASEVRGSGVVVTALCPGPTRTEFQTGARMQGSKLVRRLAFMDSEKVARLGYEGLMKGRSLVIPGLQNRLLAGLVRFLPRRVVIGAVRRVQSPSGDPPVP
ncbi:MAG TPA: SDR family oxidoreductase [Candidatus Polarisedimenticolia bacterium]|nr:SDR family oxidoreductase [Candidatus Polarisedimenticolia bacterium]